MKFLKYIFILFIVQLSFAQQDNLFSQYMFNPSLFNPAYTGSRAVNSLYLHHRSQWVGIDGAPSVSYVNYQSQFPSQKVGYGFSVMTESTGPINKTSVDLDWSYHIRTGLVGKLAFGIKLSTNNLNVDLSSINQYQDDAQLYANIDRKLVANLGLGFFYYTDRFYMGASVPYIYNNKHYDNPLYEAEDWKHLFATIGYVFDLNPQLKFKPSLFYRSVSTVVQQVDVSANFLLQEKVQFGASYRFSKAYAVMTAFQLNPQVLVGYSYDREETALRAFNKGSHELFIRYEFGLTKGGKTKLQSPRFF